MAAVVATTTGNHVPLLDCVDGGGFVGGEGNTTISQLDREEHSVNERTNEMWFPRALPAATRRNSRRTNTVKAKLLLTSLSMSNKHGSIYLPTLLACLPHGWLFPFALEGGNDEGKHNATTTTKNAQKRTDLSMVRGLGLLLSLQPAKATLH